MRITKKFAGDASVGKRVFHPCLRPGDIANERARAVDELKEHERSFCRRTQSRKLPRAPFAHYSTSPPAPLAPIPLRERCLSEPQATTRRSKEVLRALGEPATFLLPTKVAASECASRGACSFFWPGQFPPVDGTVRDDCVYSEVKSSGSSHSSVRKRARTGDAFYPINSQTSLDLLPTAQDPACVDAVAGLFMNFIQAAAAAVKGQAKEDKFSSETRKDEGPLIA
jgi:hypothetical protein